MTKAIRYAMFEIYGRREVCEIINELALGTYEVKRLRDGKYFRVSGLPIERY